MSDACVADVMSHVPSLTYYLSDIVAIIAITEVKYTVALTQAIPLDLSHYLMVLLSPVIMEV